jgi:hypothetical protein
MAEISQGDYRIYKCTDCLYLQHLTQSKLLAVEKFSCNLYECEAEVLNKVALLDIVKPHAILGILRIGSIDFLVYVKVCVPVGVLDDAEIFKVKETELIPICDDTTASYLSTDIKSFITGLKNFLSLGFFYSFHYDLTTSKQKQLKIKSDSIFDSSDKKFFWNFNLYKKFLTIKNISKIWMVVSIFGYVGLYDLSETIFGPNSKEKCGLFLISRRSIHHAGTRYNTRGIDDEGHVANFVETEQIVRLSKHFLSYVQVRGSVPIFFQQTGMTAQTQITRIPEITSPAFLRHVEEIQKDFQMIFFINLLNNHKPGEKIITTNLENQIKMNNLKSCKYYYFDFQNECKYDNYDKLDSFVKNVDSIFNIFKYHCEDTSTGEIHKEQCGIIRTNCLDCLDRTNVIQTKIAWRVLQEQLNFLNINCGDIFYTNFFQDSKGHKYSFIMEAFKDLWADNGDYISIQYAGTASTITTVTKNGKHGFLGLFQHGFVSISRFYQGSFEDSFKQKCFDLFLQKVNEPYESK